MDHRDEELPIVPGGGKTYLPFGNGRSYGDVCLNEGGVLIRTRGLNRLIAFDEGTGRMRCEAGVLLSDILSAAVPKGWFLPVTPGTQSVTVGGAIANDVHGKNHHRRGTFGRHVTRFELLRSDGTRRICSTDENQDWFRATIGGLGLTGLITWAELTLRPIETDMIDQEIIRFDSLEEFFPIADESDASFEFTVAWIDCMAGGKSAGRGLFMRGNHSTDGKRGQRYSERTVSAKVPLVPPFSLVNRLTLQIFNSLYFRRPLRHGCTKVPLGSFFYPLDAIGNWNRLYGPKGLLQHQCVLPSPMAEDALKEMLRLISRGKTGSFLAVLKRFGDIPSPGLLSFPRPGVTLALDFPNQGRRTMDMLEGLDTVVRSAGGGVNPSKDARMAPVSFQSSFPQWTELSPFLDPTFSSSFWRRVTGPYTDQEVPRG